MKQLDYSGGKDPWFVLGTCAFELTLQKKKKSEGSRVKNKQGRGKKNEAATE